MRHFFRFAAIIFLALSSCLTELKVDPAQPATFVRYINGGNIERSRALIKSSDGGYIILANVEITTNTFKIKLIKTNAYGTVQWTKFFPAYGTDGSYRGNGINAVNNGYILTGENINQATGISEILIIRTNQDGDTAPNYPKTFSPPSAEGLSTSGLGISALENGNHVVLGTISGATANNMILAEVNDATIVWDNAYGSGSTTLINKLFLQENSNSYDAFWSGTVIRDNNKEDIRLVKAMNNSQNTDFDLPIGEPDLDESANDVCRVGSGFAVIGSTALAGKSRDILFKRLAADGSVLTSQTFPVNYPGTNVDTNQNEEGNAIASTSDGGFILLGTLVSSASPDGIVGRGEKDYYLIKVNAFGTVEWTREYGSKRDDVGVSILQADDGGYVILGTTRLANVETIALIKTNRNGEIE